MIDNNICFIGSLDLYGRILKVSKLKDKIITAYNNNINIVYLPLANKTDIDSIPEDIKDKITLRFIDNFTEIYNEIFK